MQKELADKLAGKIERLTNKTFKFDSRIKSGWYSAVYFLKTSEIVRQHRPDAMVTMQFFQRKNAILCGVDECIALVHTFAQNPETLVIEALNDGDAIEPLEPVLKITGHYQQFGFLEGLIDGMLARRTSVSTNVYQTAKEAQPSPIFFMGDRDDHYLNQPGDGYAAFIGGAAAQATHAMNEWWGDKGVGTIPHALIQIFGGNLIAALEAYEQTFPNDPLVALVDFNNDCVTDAVACARHFGKRLSAVRLDTSIALIDKYFDRVPADQLTCDPHGVNPMLVHAVRKALDAEGYQHVKIIVSSGFTIEKIREFKAANAPVDSYGIGSSLIKVTVSFTGDLVKLNGQPLAKVGRKERFSNRLKPVKFNPSLIEE